MPSRRESVDERPAAGSIEVQPTAATSQPRSREPRRGAANWISGETLPVTAPEPVVHVSIGRVEIRAVPATTPKTAPRRSTAMTIDEYAARRRERR